VKVFVRNFKVDKSENLDNVFYVFTFFDMTLKNVKSRVFGFWKTLKRILELWSACHWQTAKTTVYLMQWRHKLVGGSLTYFDCGRLSYTIKWKL